MRRKYHKFCLNNIFLSTEYKWNFLCHKDIRVLMKETFAKYQFKKFIFLYLLTKLHHKYFSSPITIYCRWFSGITAICSDELREILWNSSVNKCRYIICENYIVEMTIPKWEDQELCFWQGWKKIDKNQNCDKLAEILP